jgi:hypothetical protein
MARYALLETPYLVLLRRRTFWKIRGENLYEQFENISSSQSGSTTRERLLGQEEVVTQNSQYQTDYEGEGFFSHEYTKAENWTAQHGNTHISGYYNTFEAGEHYDYKQLSTNSANPSSGPGIQHGYIYRTGHSGGEETYTTYTPYDPNSGGNQGGGGYGGGGYGGGSGSGSGSSSGSSSGGSSGGGSGTGSGEGQSSSSTVVLGGALCKKVAPAISTGLGFRASVRVTL